MRFFILLFFFFFCFLLNIFCLFDNYSLLVSFRSFLFIFITDIYCTLLFMSILHYRSTIIIINFFFKQKTKENWLLSLFGETQPNTNDEQQKMKTKNPTSPSLAIVDAKYRNFSSTRFLLILDFHRVSAIQLKRKNFKVLYRCNYIAFL